MVLFVVLSREQLRSLLKTYNSYYSDQENLQLSHSQVRRVALGTEDARKRGPRSASSPWS